MRAWLQSPHFHGAGHHLHVLRGLAVELFKGGNLTVLLQHHTCDVSR